MSKDNKDLIVGLDVGTSKVTAMVAELRPDGRLEVIGLATQPSAGLKKGVVVNIEATVDAISQVVQEVELMADCKIRDVYTGIAGSHIRSFNSNGMVAIKDKEVTPLDVERVIEVARAMPIPADQQILHVLTQEFIIDGQDGVREPIGMSGVKLEVKVHIITGAVSAAQNLVKCVRRCGLEVSDLVLQPLASSFATLSEDEKDLGVCLVDIGGGTSDLAVFTQGAIRHTAVIPIGGSNIDYDVAVALRTPIAEAEGIKCDYGIAMQRLVDPAEGIDVPSVGDRASRRLSRESLAAVIQPRLQELFELVQRELRRSGYEELLSSGLVISGGTAQLAGICELGDEVFHLPVRVGSPTYQGALADVVCQPQYANVMGLVLEGAAQRRRGLQARDTRSIKHAFDRMKAWLEKNF
jgi:cell division protein FtsA